MKVKEFQPHIRLQRDDGSKVTVSVSTMARRAGLSEKKVRKVLLCLNPKDGPFTVRPFTISWLP